MKESEALTKKLKEYLQKRDGTHEEKSS
jgi:hypothetical protein